MNAALIRKQIEECNESIVQQQQSFSAQRQQIIDTIKPFVKEQLKTEVEGEVRQNSEHTKEIGKTTLSEMKKQLFELLENSEQIVDETFKDDSVWMHVGYKVSHDDRYTQPHDNQKKAKGNILNGIKIIMGYAGRILIDNKYISVGGKYCWDTSINHDYTHTEKRSSKLIYKYYPAIPQSLGKLIDEYCKSIGVLHETIVELNDLQTKLSQQEAMDLWDEV